jgi:hypothetical protein
MLHASLASMHQSTRDSGRLKHLVQHQMLDGVDPIDKCQIEQLAKSCCSGSAP